MTARKTIVLVAGEASGDQLGGKLIEALRRQWPEARFCGVGGRHMRDAGCDCWWDRDELSVMGLFEVARHLPRLLKLRRALLDRIVELRPDVLIGIDAPDFNLGLERRAKQARITTVHYVSPTVWAWRSGRVKGIGAAADLVLCLFPFEPDFYRDHGVNARYTGHPLADAIADDPDRGAARRALGLNPDGPLVALLPGSRASEVSRLAEPMLVAAAKLATREDAPTVVAALADERTAGLFSGVADALDAPAFPVVTGRALEVMAAADVVVCASGTATLECLLVNRPMVVAYRLAPATHWLMTRFKLLKSRFIALPNILAGEPLVPELIQDRAEGPQIAAAVAAWLDDPERVAALRTRFSDLHDTLRRDAAASAARAIRKLVEPADA